MTAPAPNVRADVHVPPHNRAWIVAKFGGTSVSTRARWESIARIAADHHSRGRNVLIVVSALSGITDLLKSIAEAHGDEARCREAQTDIVQRHRALHVDHSRGRPRCSRSAS